MIKNILLQTKCALGFAILLSLLAINAFAADRTWTLVRESRWQAGFSDIHFVSQQDGWIVGSDATILRTNDGGKTWEQPSKPLPFKIDFHKVWFLNPQTGWIAGEDGAVLKTTDNGETWTVLDTGTRRALSAVFFVDAEHGWAGGDGGLIIHTTDGGDTWVQQNPPTNNAIQAFHFASQQVGWAAGHGGTVVHTTDGGTDLEEPKNQLRGRY